MLHDTAKLGELTLHAPTVKSDTWMMCTSATTRGRSAISWSTPAAGAPATGSDFTVGGAQPRYGA
jgi:hypothetical protein